MKKSLFYIFSLICCMLTACTTEQTDEITSNEGYLCVAPIGIHTDVDIQPIKRAVASGLQVDIYQGSIIARTYTAGDAALNAPISLPAGTYRLVAHTPVLTEADNENAGNAIYSVQQEFQISKNATTNLTGLVAKQINMGIMVTYADYFEEGFSNITLTLNSTSGRTVTLTGTGKTQLYYFNIPANGMLSYTLTATNTDGETFTKGPVNLLTPDAKNYYLNINWEE